MIPKVIHYCWLSDDPMPEESIRYIESWKKILTDYEFVLWDKNRFDIESVLWVKEAYYQKKYAFAADYIRLYAVYNYGGIYLDTDVEVVKKFDDLLDRSLVLGYESERKNGLEAGCFGAEKGNNFIESCLVRYEKRHFLRKDGSVDTETLPIIMQNNVCKSIEEFIYPWYYFTAKKQDTGEIEKKSQTYAIHHFAGSWLSDYEKELIKKVNLAYKLLGKNFMGKLLALSFVLFLRIKSYGFVNSLKYYCERYFVKRNVSIKELMLFWKQ